MIWLKILDWPLNGNKVFTFLLLHNNMQDFQFLRHFSFEMNTKSTLERLSGFFIQVYLHYTRIGVIWIFFPNGKYKDYLS